MRLAVCALSAVLLSGCSWLGTGGQQVAGFNQGHGGAYGGVNCAPTQQGFAQQGFVQQGFAGQAGCLPGQGGYAVQQGAFGGQQGFGHGAGQGFSDQQGFGGQSVGFGGQQVAGFGGQNAGFGQGFGGQQFASQGFTQGSVATLGSAAPYGTAVGNPYGNVVGTQLSNGQYVNGAAVQNVVGAPIYQAQPYGVPCCGPQLRGPAAALPWGFEAGIGTDFGVGGDIFQGRPEDSVSGFGPATGGAVGTSRFVSAIDPISFNDAFDEAIQYDAAVTRDLSPSTTVLGRFGYSEANGQSVDLGSAFEAPGTAADAQPVIGQFSDLEQITLEAGVRQYIGGFANGITGLRPYVGASAGARYNNSVDLVQSSAAFNGGAGGADPAIEFIDSGWNPTAAGLVGAEWQVGGRSAIGVETGIRWQDNLDTVLPSEDIWTVPVRLRGRLSF